MSTLTRLGAFPDFAELRQRFEHVSDDFGNGAEHEESYGDGMLEIKVPVPKRQPQEIKVASKGA